MMYGSNSARRPLRVVSGGPQVKGPRVNEVFSVDRGLGPPFLWIAGRSR